MIINKRTTDNLFLLGCQEHNFVDVQNQNEISFSLCMLSEMKGHLIQNLIIEKTVREQPKFVTLYVPYYNSLKLRKKDSTSNLICTDVSSSYRHQIFALIFTFKRLAFR